MWIWLAVQGLTVARKNGRQGARFYSAENTSSSFTQQLQRKFETFGDALQTECVIAASAAGAEVFYKAMRANVPVKSGKLHDAIYIYRDRNSKPGTSTFYIGPNKNKAPHWHWIEFGHWLYNRKEGGYWMRSKKNKNQYGPEAHTLPGRLVPPRFIPPQSYIRRTWNSVQATALAAARKRMAEKVAEILFRK